MAVSQGRGRPARGLKRGQRWRTARSSEAPSAADGDSTPTVKQLRWVSTIRGRRRSCVRRSKRACSVAESLAPTPLRCNASTGVRPPPRPAAKGPQASQSVRKEATHTSTAPAGPWTESGQSLRCSRNPSSDSA